MAITINDVKELTVIPVYDNHVYVEISYNPETHMDELSLPSTKLDKYLTVNRAYNSILNNFRIDTVKYKDSYYKSKLCRVCILFKEPLEYKEVTRVRVHSREYNRLMMKYPYLEELIRDVV